jgi:hypothetical protein
MSRLDPESVEGVDRDGGKVDQETMEQVYEGLTLEEKIDHPDWRVDIALSRFEEEFTTN